MKKIFSVFLIISLVFALFGCVKSKESETVSQASENVTAAESTTQAPSAINPLTGSKKFDQKAVGKRPVAIVVENQPQARPQWAIGTADIIIEGETEGGISRMLWLYADYRKVPKKVGPIRSARPPFIGASELFDSIFVHWGGSHSKNNYTGGYTVLKKHRVDHIDGMNGGKLFGRDKTRSVAIEHRGILYGNRLETVIKEKKIRKKIKGKRFSAFKFSETQQKAGEREALSVKCRFSSRTDARKFTYSTKDKKYHTNDWKKDVSFKNIIVLKDETTYITVPYKGSTTTYLNYKSFVNKRGEGVGVWASNGGFKKIRWKIENGRLSLTDKNNREIELNKGKTYIGLASSNHDGKVTI